MTQSAEILIGHEENRSILRSALDNFDGVTTGANDVRKGLNTCAAVDVGNHVVVFPAVGIEKGGQISGGQESDNEQPASMSGITTFLLGLIIFAVSPMKCTPQKR